MYISFRHGRIIRPEKIPDPLLAHEASKLRHIKVQSLEFIRLFSLLRIIHRFIPVSDKNAITHEKRDAIRHLPGAHTTSRQSVWYASHPHARIRLIGS